MNFELLKQLKDAGYGYLSFKTERTKKFPNKPYNFEGQDTVYTPTLSELIVACGDKFNNLHFFHYERKNLDNKWICNFNDEFNADGDSEGTTPEEAVARLWLKLNK